MSSSPSGGDVETDIIADVKSNRMRPASQDDGIVVVPSKISKVDDINDNNLNQNNEENLDEDEEDDNAALDDDYDDEDDEELDLGEDGDGEEAEYENEVNEENILDETGESSTDMEEYIQANLAYIEDCQTDIDTLNQKANDEILKVEQKYNKLRQPVYSRRNSYIERIPYFWANVFSRHPQLKRVLTKEDVKCFRFLTNLQLDDFEDTRSGYSIKFHFDENPWFSNSSITKEYHLPWHDSPSCECSTIDWKPGMDLTENTSSFFSWFCSQDDASTDDIAEIIKEELWPNPLQCYFTKEVEEAESLSEESDEDSVHDEEAPVYITDDGAEYISSEDEDPEEWTQLPNSSTRGKQGNVEQISETGPYVIEDEDDDEEDYDDDEDDDEEYGDEEESSADGEAFVLEPSSDPSALHRPTSAPPPVNDYQSLKSDTSRVTSSSTAANHHRIPAAASNDVTQPVVTSSSTSSSNNEAVAEQSLHGLVASEGKPPPPVASSSAEPAAPDTTSAGDTT